MPEETIVSNESNHSDSTDSQSGSLVEVEVDADDACAGTGGACVSPADFNILRVIGQGSFGKVYLVRKLVGKDAGTLYAMKVLKKASLKVRDRHRTTTERNILADADHPFIVRLHYAFQTKGRLYLIMEFLRGGDLYTRLGKAIMFTESEVKFYLAELALALGHLHQRGIVYRDLKPENVLLDASGHVKLTDFGLSKTSLKDDNSKTYSFCGTVEYMAPEVVNRKGHGTASDWWSFGVLMYEMLTGSLPFQGDTRQETMRQILRAKLTMPQLLSTSAKALLRALFKRNPSNRLGSGAVGFQEVQRHAFFSDVNWQQVLARQCRAPFQPERGLTDDELVRYFDCELLNSTPQDSPAIPSSESMEMFRDFAFVSPTLLTTTGGDDSDDSDDSLGTTASELAAIAGVRPGAFEEEYQLMEALGGGQAAVCHRCRKWRNGWEGVVKIIDCSKRSPQSEVSTLLTVTDHPNVVTVSDVFVSQDGSRLYLVTELLRGGDLESRLRQRRSFDEREAAGVVTSVCRALQRLHSLNIAHGAVTPDNLLFAERDAGFETVRLSGFSSARQLLPGQSQSPTTRNGRSRTPYTPPELLGDTTGCQVTPAGDIWSVGVILYAMLNSGQTLSNVEEELTTAMDSLAVDASAGGSGGWQLASDAAKDLLRRMLTTDPSARLSASEVLRHPWLSWRRGMQHAHQHSHQHGLRALSLTDCRMPQLQSVAASELAKRRQSRDRRSAGP